MLNTDKQDMLIGFTDSGEPIVMPEYTCNNWQPGAKPTLNMNTCWYCRFADFRKTTFTTLTYSICRCNNNRQLVVDGNKNEACLVKEAGVNKGDVDK